MLKSEVEWSYTRSLFQSPPVMDALDCQLFYRQTFQLLYRLGGNAISSLISKWQAWRWDEFKIFFHTTEEMQKGNTFNLRRCFPSI